MQVARRQFPESYEADATERLLEAYSAAPRRLRASLAGLDDSDLRQRPHPGKWSIKEIVAHVAESEMMCAARVRFVFAQPGTAFVGYDQDIWARAFAYNDLDPLAFEQAIELFTVLRSIVRRVFDQATDVEWRQSGVHPDFGPVTLRQLLELYADHGERHIAQILRLRESIGKPVDLPLLLERRLY